MAVTEEVMYLLIAYNFKTYGDTCYFGPFPTRARAIEYAKSAGYERGINEREGGYKIVPLIIPFVCNITWKDQ